jgi:hypothetical protein
MYLCLVRTTSKPSAKNYTLDFLALPAFFGSAAEIFMSVVKDGVVDPALMLNSVRTVTPDARASAEMFGAVLMLSMILSVFMLPDCMCFFVHGVY